MQDDQLLQNLTPSSPFAAETVEALRQAGITTYNQLFGLLRDETADAELRAKAAWAMSWLHRIVDKRRAVPPLLVALQSHNDDVRYAAAHTLGVLDSRRAVKPLMRLASDKNLPEWVRVETIIALCSIDDQQSSQFLRKVIFDQTEHLEVRSHAIEWMHNRDLEAALQDWITLLSDPASDIRFWAVYRLSQTFSNIVPALTELDRIVAYDHSVPEYWGWHVDREAIRALEEAYMQVWTGCYEDCDNLGTIWLVSPALEYDSYFQEHRKKLIDGATDATTPLSPVTLDLDPAWLADRLREQWPDAQLDTRDPRPQAYLLDWRMTIDGKILSGALHRDRYAVVITGDDVYPFAAWYRSIIAPEQPLFLYEWADFGVELRPGMMAGDIEEAKRAEDDRLTMKA